MNRVNGMTYPGAATGEAVERLVKAQAFWLADSPRPPSIGWVLAEHQPPPMTVSSASAQYFAGQFDQQGHQLMLVQRKWAWFTKEKGMYAWRCQIAEVMG